MFLHLGQDVVIPLDQVISIVRLADYESEINKIFLKTAEEEGFVIQLGEEPISCIVTSAHVYLSPISVQTLKKRACRSYQSEFNC